METETDDAARIAIAADKLFDVLGVEAWDAAGHPVGGEVEVGALMEGRDHGHTVALERQDRPWCGA